MNYPRGACVMVHLFLTSNDLGHWLWISLYLCQVGPMICIAMLHCIDTLEITLLSWGLSACMPYLIQYAGWSHNNLRIRLGWSFYNFLASWACAEFCTSGVVCRAQITTILWPSKHLLYVQVILTQGIHTWNTVYFAQTTVDPKKLNTPKKGTTKSTPLCSS